MTNVIVLQEHTPGTPLYTPSRCYTPGKFWYTRLTSIVLLYMDLLHWPSNSQILHWVMIYTAYKA